MPAQRRRPGLAAVVAAGLALGVVAAGERPRELLEREVACRTVAAPARATNVWDEFAMS